MNVILKIAYDGTNYSGWQKQLNANSIQQELERHLSQIYDSEINLIGAGRTDSGVHSIGQIANFEIEKKSILKKEKICKILNEKLYSDVKVENLWYYDSEFNARYDAIARQYKYRIITRKDVFDNRYKSYIKYPIEFDKLKEIENIFIGTKDFTAFSKLNKDTKNYICSVEICNWQKKDENNFELTIKADRFVYGMVRTIVGAMIEFARSKKSKTELLKQFEINKRVNTSPLADAKGLTLEKVFYQPIFDFLN